MTLQKFSFVSLLCLVIVACSHPIEIVGNGDVISTTGTRNCYLEDYQAGLDNCAVNLVIDEYTETYTAEPRPGWQFEGWENYCEDAPDNECSFSIAADLVEMNWGATMSPLVAVFTPESTTTAVRSVRNLLTGPMDHLQTPWTVYDPHGAISYANDGYDVTYTYPPDDPPTSRGFSVRTIRGIEAGRTYALRMKISDKSGVWTRQNIQIKGDGISTVELTDITAGIRAFLVHATSNANITVRVGYGIPGNEVAPGASFTVSNISFHKLAIGQTMPSEYTNVEPEYRNSVGFHREILSTLESPEDGALLTEAYGPDLSTSSLQGIAFIADSFGNESDEFIRMYENLDESRYIHALSTSGLRLEQVLTTDIDAVITQGIEAGGLTSGIVFLQPIVNDIIGNRLASNILVHLDTLVQHAAGLGLPVIVSTCPPFGNSVNHSISKQAEALAWNAQIKTHFASNPNVYVYDIYALLAESGTFNLKAEFDRGDGLHPNDFGHQAIAADIASTIDSVTEFIE